MFEREATERLDTTPQAVWALWSNVERWPDWNDQVQHAELDGPLAAGTTVRTKLRRGGTVSHVVTALEPERLLAYEARFPGARAGYEHRLRPGRRSVEVTHRRYVTGPLWALWAPMLGRKRIRESVERYLQRTAELTAGSSGRA